MKSGKQLGEAAMTTGTDCIFCKIVFAVSTVLAVLRGGRCRRRHRDDPNRAILGAHGNAAILLWLL